MIPCGQHWKRFGLGTLSTRNFSDGNFYPVYPYHLPSLAWIVNRRNGRLSSWLNFGLIQELALSLLIIEGIAYDENIFCLRK